MARLNGPIVIGAGLPRTASLSLKIALERLGYAPCHHLIQPVCQFDRLKRSAAALKCTNTIQRRQMLRELFDDQSAILDLPGNALVDDLVALYPDAKFILTIRKSPDIWLASALGWAVLPWSKKFRILGYWTPGGFDCSDLFIAWAKTYKSRFGLSHLPSREMYIKHCEFVKAVVPKEQLLTFEPSMGWGPLCAFLGKPVPTNESGKMDPFPHINDRTTMNGLVSCLINFGVLLWVLVLIVLVLALRALLE